MEALAFLALGFAALMVIAPILALIAFSRTSRVERELRSLREDLAGLDTKVSALARRVVGGQAPMAEPRAAEPHAAEPPAPAPPPEPPPPAAAARVVPTPRAAAPSPPASAPPARPLPPRPPAPAPPSASPDFATTLGPKILVAMGAVACIVFLALFVKYAWENNWVGPTGRVLLGATVSLALVALGLRLLDGELRPLGQGLAGLGFAGLYVSAFGAHGFYDLIPREAAGILMLAITAAAVLLAARLDTRLLAALAWLGGYLTPVLLSTGEDKALSLYLYLAVLDAGALVLDRRKPWPETVPLAFIGTMLLYAGWFGQFFRPERFEVAALGIVLFTALFVFGMASKERGLGVGIVLSVAAFWATALAAGADRPEMVLVLSLALGAAAVRLASRLGWGLWPVAAVALALPFVAWNGAHYGPERFGIAAAWVVLGMLLFVWPAPREAAAGFFQAAALFAGALASIVLAARTDRPVALLALLAAQAGIAALFRRRWAGSEVVGISGAGLAVLAWFGRFYTPERADQALLLAIALAGLYFLALVVRSLVLRRALGGAGLVAHFVNATFLWTVLFRVLYHSSPAVLGLASVALAALYLGLGLVALRTAPGDVLQVRVLLGLAAGFLTLAIPVQLGLNGITLAWAIEATLLAWLGVRFESLLTRAGGYAVLGLTVLRLLARHLPLHQGAFAPVFNPAFGIWIAVIVTLGVAVALTRAARQEDAPLDRVVAVLMSALALVLLLAVLTGETQAAFGQIAENARQAGQLEAAQTARRMSGLSVSVLWTLFATGLLAAGLALRNRPLFYSAYALFAFTAAKVVLVDLATFQTLYRMLSVLALGVLLLAGAYLNLRFRERLLPRGGAAVILAALLLAASPAPPPFERAMETAGPGRVAIVLDREVYEGARADLGDLRVVDDRGALVPYWLQRGEGQGAVRRPAVIRNRGFLRGRSATATLDFGGPLHKRELVIVSGGDSFRRRVVVEGGADGESWLTLTDGAYVFAVPGAEAARYEKVPLPENDYRYLRVTLFRDADDPEKIEIRDAWVEGAVQATREEALIPTLTRAEDGERRETVLSLDLGARHQPIAGVVVQAEDPRFFRGVVVEARRDPPPPRPGQGLGPIEWVRLAEGALYRYPEGDKTCQALRLGVSGRERMLRLRIRNRDDRPLSIRGVTVMAPVERVVFEAEAGRRYRLTYGSLNAAAPAFDLGRTIGDHRAWADAASPARLGPVVRLAAASPSLPWTERHPGLLWGGLLGVVAALGAVTWRALKAAR